MITPRPLVRLALAALALTLVPACGDDTSDGGGGSGAGGTTTPPGGGGEPAAMAGITAAHNAARAAVEPPAASPIPPLTWSGEVAAVAQAYADKCVFKHSGGPYGENLYASSASSTAEAVVESWASEKAEYDYAADSCSDECGHYTQVVWAASLRLGCGVTTCTTGSPFGGGEWQNWVCNYDPPGNYIGQRPY